MYILLKYYQKNKVSLYKGVTEFTEELFSSYMRVIYPCIYNSGMNSDIKKALFNAVPMDIIMVSAITIKKMLLITCCVVKTYQVSSISYLVLYRM